MTREQDAQPARVEVEAVSLRQPAQRMPDEYHLELKPLQLIRCFHDHLAKADVRQRRAHEVLLVIVRDPDGHHVRIVFG